MAFVTSRRILASRTAIPLQATRTARFVIGTFCGAAWQAGGLQQSWLLPSTYSQASISSLLGSMAVWQMVKTAEQLCCSCFWQAWPGSSHCANHRQLCPQRLIAIAPCVPVLPSSQEINEEV